MEPMDLEKNPILIQRNPNNDLKYFNEVRYQTEHKEMQNDNSEEKSQQNLQYITE